ncbi:hypothetical protein GCM10023322_76140 [Rugosimonospora acidiphila]|uniref:Uncharacterized protein n=1 Tax=Rugosimonospora acidiphila TaxID=556531 RepID=A0ABP9SNM2_9ACTN
MATARTTTAGSARAERREAARALVEHSWAEVDTPRPTARPHLVLTVVALAAAAALGGGAVLQLVHPLPLSEASASTVPPPVTAAPYTAVSGWDCATASDHGFDVQGRTADWYTVASGGWDRDGCHGTFEAIPMSGDKSKDDPNQHAVWWFTPTAAMTRCAISVYGPAAQNPQDAAAAPAQFWVLTGRTGARLAGSLMDQTASRGTWVSLGTYPVSAAGIAVELVDRGTPATPASRLAVSQVRVQCTA